MAMSGPEDLPYLFTYDGVKIRLYNFQNHHLLKDMDFLHSDTISFPLSIYDSSMTRTLFLLVKDHRKIIVYDTKLELMNSLEKDTSMIILTIAFSQEQSVLYITGNNGSIHAYLLYVKIPVQGAQSTWKKLWIHEEPGKWIQHLAIDEKRKLLFGAFETSIMIFSTINGGLKRQFVTLHKAPISGLCYSDGNTLLITSSSDGQIQLWTIHDNSQIQLNTIQQRKFGPIQLLVDNHSFFSLSHERIIRRYDLITHDLIAEINLEPTVNLEEKNIESIYNYKLVQYDSKFSNLFFSEKNILNMFEVHFSPPGLGVLCDNVSGIFTSSQGYIFTVVQNNVLHLHCLDSSIEAKDFDYEIMPVSNVLNPKKSFSQILNY